MVSSKYQSVSVIDSEWAPVLDVAAFFSTEVSTPSDNFLSDLEFLFEARGAFFSLRPFFWSFRISRLGYGSSILLTKCERRVCSSAISVGFRTVNVSDGFSSGVAMLSEPSSASGSWQVYYQDASSARWSSLLNSSSCTSGSSQTIACFQNSTGLPTKKNQAGPTTSQHKQLEETLGARRILSIHLPQLSYYQLSSVVE